MANGIGVGGSQRSDYRAHVFRVQMKMSTKKKLLAIAPLLLPVGFLLMFAIGEGFTEGFGHYIQLAPIVLFAIIAWFKPRIAGWLFISFGTLMMVLFLYSSFERNQPAIANLMVIGIIFFPILISGYLMLKPE
jgi:hypothetical protein